MTTRTAGFNTADLSGMTGASQAIMIVLMMIGGAPAVSYTHLDVYKRQVLGKAIKLCLECVGIG